MVKIDFDDLAVEGSSDVAFVHCVVTFAAHSGAGDKIRRTSNRFTFGLQLQKV